MDDPQSDNNSSEEEIQDNNKDKQWNINLEKEKIFWKENILNKFVYSPKICPLCNKLSLKVYENNSDSIINPFYTKCRNYKCKVKKILKNILFLNLIKLYLQVYY